MTGFHHSRGKAACEAKGGLCRTATRTHLQRIWTALWARQPGVRGCFARHRARLSRPAASNAADSSSLACTRTQAASYTRQSSFTAVACAAKSHHSWSDLRFREKGRSIVTGGSVGHLSLPDAVTSRLPRAPGRAAARGQAPARLAAPRPDTTVLKAAGRSASFHQPGIWARGPSRASAAAFSSTLPGVRLGAPSPTSFMPLPNAAGLFRRLAKKLRCWSSTLCVVTRRASAKEEHKEESHAATGRGRTRLTCSLLRRTLPVLAPPIHLNVAMPMTCVAVLQGRDRSVVALMMNEWRSALLYNRYYARFKFRPLKFRPLRCRAETPSWAGQAAGRKLAVMTRWWSRRERRDAGARTRGARLQQTQKRRQTKCRSGARSLRPGAQGRHTRRPCAAPGTHMLFCGSRPDHACAPEAGARARADTRVRAESVREVVCVCFV